MRRIMDVLAIGAVALVLLLPKASVTAQPAVAGLEPIELDRLTELQDERYRRPGEVEPALALADGFLSAMRPDWALATLVEFAGRGDYRVHLMMATAHAERLESKEAVAEADRVAALCDDAKAQPACRPGTEVRVGLIRQAMQVLVDGAIDPAKDPVKARDAVAKVLHTSRYNMSSIKVAPPSPPSGGQKETPAAK